MKMFRCGNFTCFEARLPFCPKALASLVSEDKKSDPATFWSSYGLLVVENCTV